jgi:uncharacterized protein with von Willebrand factor type A (vWA) domain
VSLEQHLAGFARELRAAGVRVALSDELDALAGLGRVDLLDVEEVRWALRCTLKIRARDAAAFERLFARWWRPSANADAAAAMASLTNPSPGGARPAPRVRPAPEIVPDEDAEPGWTREAMLVRKPFDRCDERDLAQMEPIIQRLAARLATRRSRRLVPTPGRGKPDPRRSLRRALSTGGELLRLARRARPVEAPRLVFLCDTSGSMGGCARFLLAFARALAKVAGGTEVFVFNTALARVTPQLSSGNLALALARLEQAVPDWAGGTRIGECLGAFADRHLAELVDSRTVVIILSDGLDRGEPERVAAAMRRIAARARRVLWLNPLTADPRYEPTARGMAAALPYIDRLAPVSDLETLERLVPQLSI